MNLNFNAYLRIEEVLLFLSGVFQRFIMPYRTQYHHEKHASQAGNRRTFDNGLRGEFLDEASLLAGFEVEVESEYGCDGR
jgi:hypothetical protein